MNRKIVLGLVGLGLLALIVILVVVFRGDQKPDSKTANQNQEDQFPGKIENPQYEWITYVSKHGYDVDFPGTWVTVKNVGDAEIILTNDTTKSLEVSNRFPHYVFVGLASVQKSSKDNTKDLVTNRIPASERKAASFSSLTTDGGLAVVKAVYGTGINNQAVYGVELSPNQVIMLEASGYITNSLVEAIVKSVSASTN